MPEENELGQEKSEAPTARRRNKSREKGSVARSKEINSAVMLFFGLCVFALYGPYLMQQIVGMIKYAFTHFPEIEVSASNIHAYAIGKLLFVLRLLVPIFLVFIVVGIVSNIAQFGWLFTSKTLFQGLKNFSLSPSKLFKRIFSTNNLVTTGINILKLTILITLAYHTLKIEVVKFPTLVSMPLNQALLYIALMLFKLALKIIALLVIIGIIDFIWQKYKHEKSLKMTKQEVKEEMKQVEGDPKIRQHIKSAQIKMMVSSMVRKVPDADVVITNPFHVAIAIKYDRAIMNAPMIIAKGARLIAERIKEAARNAGVPIIENKPIAQTLYKTIDVGEEIPPKLYKAVAEILAYVYRLNKERMQEFATV